MTCRHVEAIPSPKAAPAKRALPFYWLRLCYNIGSPGLAICVSKIPVYNQHWWS